MDILLDMGQNVERWLGEGFAVQMHTAEKNTVSADWWLVQRLKRGQNICYFVQMKFVKGKLNTEDILARYKALEKAFADCG